MIAFIISAITASIGGVFIASLSKSAAYYYGSGYDFAAITAIVLSGVILEGGTGSMIGVLGGVLTMGLLSNVLTLIGMGTFSQEIVRGVVFIIVVWVTSFSKKKWEERNA